MDKTGRSSTLDWTAEDDYWRTNYKTRPYASGSAYDVIFRSWTFCSPSATEIGVADGARRCRNAGSIRLR